MNKQLRIAGLVFVLGLILGLSHWQQQGWAAGQAGNGLKQAGNKLQQLFSPAGTSKTISPVPATAPAAPMATITVTSLADGATANAANCPGANCRLRDAIEKAVAGDTIDFSVTGQISLVGDHLSIDRNLTINGPAGELLIRRNRLVFFVAANTTFVVNNLKITGIGAALGSGIRNEGTTILNNSALVDCSSANLGGAIYNTGTMTISNSLLSDNSVSAIPSFGGAIYNTGNLTITGSTLSGNLAPSGGAIYNTGNLTITGSTLSGNLGDNGGGIYNKNGIVTVANSTLGGNNVNQLGGGILVDGGTLNLSNSTLTANIVQSQGGGIFSSLGTINVRNTLIAGNTAFVSRPDVSGTLISQGYNLIGNNSGANITPTTGDQIGTPAAPINPLLAPLANYGGPTQTYALLPGSPAINAGTNCVLTNNCASNNLGFNLTTDQRGTGFNRQVGSTVDIGAFESRGFTLTVAGGNNQSANSNTAFANPLAVTVAASGAGEPVNGGMVTFTPPPSGASATLAGNPATITGGTATSGTVTANATSGAYNVAAGATGATAINFALTNLPPPNTAPTISDIANQTINEDSNTGALAFTVGDAQTPAASLTLSGASSNQALVPNANIVFGGSGANRTVTVTPVANQSGTATITVTVTDAGGLMASDTFVLTVNAVNDNPTISDIANQTTNEDTPTSAIAFTIGDVETPAANLTLAGSSSNLTLVPNGNIVFGGSGANRTVTITPAANQAGTTTITVTVSDGSGGATPDSFVLTVNAANDPPTISNVANQTINEDANTGALAFTVGDVETPAASLTLTGSSSNQGLVPNANIVFGGSGANRTVTVTPAANQSGTATITIIVTDANSGTASDTFLLTVNAINDPPTISDIANQTINEDANTGALSFTVGDVETPAASLTLSGNSSNPTLVPPANIVFGGTGASRTVTVTPAANQAGTATITITVTDANSGTASDTFALTVNAVNDPPTISDVTNQTINEDANTGALSFSVGDAETPAASLTLSGSSSNPTLVPNANIVFGGAAGSRTVTITPVANQSGAATITITVTDAGGSAMSDTFLLTVNAVNDNPTISDITNQTTNEDTATSAIAFTIGDVETPAASLTLAGTSSNTTLVPNANIVFGGAGANRTVTITPAANQTGTATITITVTDANGATASDTFLLTVNGTNDPPTISDIANQTTNEDTATGAIAFTIGDAETAAANLTLVGTSSNTTLVPNANIVFGGAGANRTVTITPAANQVGTATITVTVSDGSGGSTPDSFVLTVNAVNDNPTVSDVANQTINEDGTTGALAFTIGDIETPAANLTVAGGSSNLTLVPNASIVFAGSGANRTVTITPAPNQSGTASITLTVMDANGAVANDTFLLTVNAVSDPPTISDLANQSISVNANTGALPVTVGDAETAAASLTLTGSSSNTTLVPNTNIVFGGSGANRTVTVTPAANQSGTTTITLTVTDGAGLTANDIFLLQVSACAATLSKTGQNFAANGGTGSFTVQIDAACPWTATSNDPSFITVTAPAGSVMGTGNVSFTVGSHSNPAPRSGTITVAGQTFTVRQGAQFLDVPLGAPFYEEIGKLSAVGVTQGCGGGNYCPGSNVTREQMAAFIIRSLGDFNPPVPAMQRFLDVPPSNPFYAFIEQMALRGITSGCGGGNYCPAQNVTREQMAAFIIRALHEPGYVPPTPASQRFADVPPGNPFYAHIEEMAVRQITLGCGGGNYCPTQNVTRGQMAAFLVRAFNL